MLVVGGQNGDEGGKRYHAAGRQRRVEEQKMGDDE